MVTRIQMDDETARSAIVRDMDQSLEKYGGDKLDQALKDVVHQARILVGAHQAALSYIPGGDFGAAVHAVSLSEKYEKYQSYDVMPTGQGIWSLIIQRKASFCMTHEELVRHPSWKNFSDLKDARGLEHPPMRGWLAVPILNRKQEVVGFLQLSDKLEGEFRPQDLNLVTQLAKLIAPTLELETLTKELQHLAEESRAQRRAALNLAQDAHDIRARAVEAEERLNLALQSSEVGTWHWNIVQNTIIWDDFIHPLFGLKPGTFPGRYEAFLNLVHPDDLERVQQEVTLAVENESPYDTEFQVVWPDGSIHVVRARGKVYRDASGRAERMTGVCWDVTERKRLEDRFRAMVESAPTAMLMVDEAGAILLVNKMAEKLFHYERNELLGQQVEVLVPPRHRASHARLRDEYFAHPPERTMGEGRFLSAVRKDGSEFSVEIGLGPTKTDEGQFVLAAVVDITERLQAEQALRDREEHIRLLLNATAEAIYGVDIRGICTFCNQSCVRMLGYSDANELIGRNMHQTIHHSRADGTPLPVEQCRIFQAFQKQVGTHVDDEVLWRKDGTSFPAEYWSYPLVHEGRVNGSVVTFLDITERRQAEETMHRQAQELMRSNKELEQFAYIASHDLQEPLRKVQSFGDLLVAKSGEALGEEGRDYLARMRHAALRMQGLISDLLSFSRVTSQAKPFLPVDLGKVAHEVVSDLEVRIKSSGGSVCLSELPTLEGDASQMRQLLQNLIGNALKFHHRDVPPVVAVRSRILHASNNGDSTIAPSVPRCEITVEDNGIGFDEKYLDRIFSPFQRLHGRGEYEGTGIGLAICRKIVERHDGAITARSTSGKGTTFIVTLPLRQGKGKSGHGSP